MGVRRAGPRTKTTHADTAFPAIGTIMIHQRADNFVCIGSRKCAGQGWFGWHGGSIRADLIGTTILIWYGNRQTTQEQKQEQQEQEQQEQQEQKQQEQEQQVAAVGARASAAGAGSRLSTDGCKQNERIATIGIILINSDWRWWALKLSQLGGFRFGRFWWGMCVIIFLTLLCNCKMSDICGSRVGWTSQRWGVGSSGRQ